MDYIHVAHCLVGNGSEHSQEHFLVKSSVVHRHISDFVLLRSGQLRELQFRLFGAGLSHVRSLVAGSGPQVTP